MNNVFELVHGNPLFDGIDFSDFSVMFEYIDARTKQFKKNEPILLSGNPIDFVGIVLHGSVKIVRSDSDGNDTILTELFSQAIFGETFACAGIGHSPVSIIATDASEILLFDYRKVVMTCGSSSGFQARLIENMLSLIAKKNLVLNQKIDVLSKRTLREKLLCFFEYERKGAREFTIHFNREELASYLCADRSAVSAELSKMQKNGMIRYTKNTFELLH